jgi:decaprenyl-diphosphate synthase subunit 2
LNFQISFILQSTICRDSDGSGDISRAVRNYIESQFIGDRDSESFPLPSNPNLKMECEFVTEEDKNLDGVEDKKLLSMSRIFGHPKREWIYRNVMSTGSMLGAFSKWSMKFSKASSQHQNSAYNFGKNYALTVNAFTQLLPFIEPQKFNGNKFCLVSAPVLFQLDETPVMYEEIVKGRDSIENIDYDKLYRMITDGCGIERTKELLVEFSVNALYELGNFKSSKSKDALENIIISMMEAQKVFS